MHLKDSFLFFILLGLWLVAEMVINPIGNFPLNDDWAYAQNVYFLAEEGRFDFSDWPGMTLIVQVLWGAMVCKLFGFSFTVLRFSTLLLAIVTSWGSYRLFRQYTDHKMLAFFTSVLLMFNPFFLSMANSFMTEVPFLAVFLPAVYCFLKRIDDEKNGQKYWLAIGFSLLATLIRQPGLFAPLAFAIVFLFKNYRSLSVKKITLALFPFLLCFVAMKIYTMWLAASQGLPPLYGQIGLLFDSFRNGTFGFDLAIRNNDMLFLTGLFTLPLLIILLPYYWRESTRQQKLIATLVAGVVCSSYFFYLDFLPMGNVFRNFALGPNTMPGDAPVPNSAFGDITPTPKLPPVCWLVVKILGMVSGVLLIFQIAISLLFRFAQKRWSTCFLLVLLLGYHAFLVLNPYYFDRHTLVAIPVVLMLLLPQSIHKLSFKRNLYFSFAALGLIVLFSVLGTHDYLSWSKARWEIVKKTLIERGVPPKMFYPGFEPDHWHRRVELQPVSTASKKDSVDHLLTFQHKVCGYQNIEIVTYDHWLPPGRDSIFLHRKMEVDTFQYFVCDIESTDSTRNFLKTTNPDVLIENNALIDSTKAHSGKYSLRLDKDHAFAFKTKLELKGRCQRLVAIVWRKKKEDTQTDVFRKASVFAFSADGYYIQDENVKMVSENGWELVVSVLYPDEEVKSDSLNLYLWNCSGEEQWLDDFTVKSFGEK